MKPLKLFTLILLLTGFYTLSFAQSPMQKKIGFGILVGDPTGGTLKIWTNPVNAFVVDIGSSYFGSPRIGVDYIWHFNTFHSRIANLYAGPGGVLGVGEGTGFWYKNKFFRTGGNVGLGVRGVCGVNIIPENTPLEVFFELGLLVGFSPGGSSFDAALGIRFYP